MSVPVPRKYRLIEGDTFNWKDGTQGKILAANDCGSVFTLNRDVTGFKKVRHLDRHGEFCYYGNGSVIELLIPAGTRIRAPWENSHLPLPYAEYYNNHKCRAERAIMVSKNPSRGHKYVSGYNTRFYYESGKLVVPSNGEFDPRPGVECAIGIHFFFRRNLARKWR